MRVGQHGGGAAWGVGQHGGRGLLTMSNVSLSV